MTDTGNQARAARRKLGLTQRDVAKRFGMRQATVSEWETATIGTAAARLYAAVMIAWAQLAEIEASS